MDILYAKTEKKLDVFEQTAEFFRTDIDMVFGINKCKAIVIDFAVGILERVESKQKDEKERRRGTKFYKQTSYLQTTASAENIYSLTI